MGIKRVNDGSDIPVLLRECIDGLMMYKSDLITYVEEPNAAISIDSLIDKHFARGFMRFIELTLLRSEIEITTCVGADGEYFIPYKNRGYSIKRPNGFALSSSYTPVNLTDSERFAVIFDIIDRMNHGNTEGSENLLLRMTGISRSFDVLIKRLTDRIDGMKHPYMLSDELRRLREVEPTIPNVTVVNNVNKSLYDNELEKHEVTADEVMTIQQRAIGRVKSTMRQLLARNIPNSRIQLTTAGHREVHFTHAVKETFGSNWTAFVVLKPYECTISIPAMSLVHVNAGESYDALIEYKSIIHRNGYPMTMLWLLDVRVSDGVIEYDVDLNIYSIGASEEV